MLCGATPRVYVTQRVTGPLPHMRYCLVWCPKWKSAVRLSVCICPRHWGCLHVDALQSAVAWIQYDSLNSSKALVDAGGGDLFERDIDNNVKSCCVRSPKVWPRFSRKRGLGPTLQHVGVCIKAVCNHTSHHGNGIVHGRLTSKRLCSSWSVKAQDRC